MMLRRVTAIAAIIAAAFGLAGCDRPVLENQFETSLPSAYAGFRITDGKLNIWTGSPCVGTTMVDLKFRPYQGGGTAELQLSTPTYDEGLTPGVQFEFLTLGGPYPGFTVTRELPTDFDWRTAQELILQVGGPAAARGTNYDFAKIAGEITARSADYPDDAFWFPGAGWLNTAEVAQKDGAEFLAMCTPDPTKAESRDSVFGVRVTDGALRLWAGAPCRGVDGAIVTFQPQADLVLNRTDNREEIEYFTIGGPYPDFTVTNPLPADFDWRTAQSVLLRIVTNGAGPVRTANLAVPIAESAQNPDDTYFFEGVGWLDPAAVAAGDGRDFTTVCGG